VGQLGAGGGGGGIRSERRAATTLRKCLASGLPVGMQGPADARLAGRRSDEAMISDSVSLEEIQKL